MKEFLHNLRQRLYVRPCDGTCGDDSFHTGHLTLLGIKRYTRVKVTDADLEAFRKACLGDQE